MSSATDTIYRMKFFKRKRYTKHNYKCLSIHTPLMMAQDWAQCTTDIINYGRFIKQFLQDSIKLTCQRERINKKIVNNVQSNMYQ